jgi:glucosamine--fructose-6-phosphate aminotransferase (isomerizing)
VLTQDGAIADIAKAHAPSRRSWAVVGNDLNRIAADEIRIKLSELCYKAVACDATEDKKHIDLSSEPLTLICAAGLTGSAADDVTKEVAIFRAHAGVPLVIATDSETRFDEAVGVIHVPPAHPDLAFILSTMAGHLFGYHAARAIDDQARPLRETRAAIEAAAEEKSRRPEELLERLRPTLASFGRTVARRVSSGEYNGTLEASTAWRLLHAFQSATSDARAGWATASGPGAVIDELTEALTAGIDELTRPIDAIKHQAKTVTVGISRADEDVLTVPVVSQLLSIGVDRSVLPYSVLKTLVALDPALLAVTGHTRYRIDGDVDSPDATVTVIDKGGSAEEVSSRTEFDPRLRGAKHRVASEREVLAAIGRSDGRPVVIVPEISGGRTVGVTLLHVEFAESLQPRQVEQVLRGYRGRIDLLESAVTETESTFDVSRLAHYSLVDLLTAPIEVLADRWLTDALPSAAAAHPD